MCANAAIHTSHMCTEIIIQIIDLILNFRRSMTELGAMTQPTVCSGISGKKYYTVALARSQCRS